MTRHMQPVSEVPFDELRVGEEVISYRGTPGVITNKIPIEKSTRFEDNELVIMWDREGAAPSYHWHFQHTNVYIK